MSDTYSVSQKKKKSHFPSPQLGYVNTEDAGLCYCSRETIKHECNNPRHWRITSRDLWLGTGYNSFSMAINR